LSPFQTATGAGGQGLQGKHLGRRPPDVRLAKFTVAACRSELARDGLKSAAFNQKTRVIVNDYREQARSYRHQGKAIRADIRA
jgi:hypothetical protein